MAILLDSIELPDLTIENEFGFTGVSAEVDFALDGTPLISESAESGEPIDLIGTDKTGWIARSVLKAVYALAAVIGAQYELNYEGRIFTVRFRNENPPAVFAEPVIARPDPADTDWYKNVKFKFMKIG